MARRLTNVGAAEGARHGLQHRAREARAHALEEAGHALLGRAIDGVQNHARDARDGALDDLKRAVAGRGWGVSRARFCPWWGAA